MFSELVDVHLLYMLPYSLSVAVLTPEIKTTYPRDFVTLLPCVMLMFCKVLDVVTAITFL